MIRIWNNDVTENLDGVLRALLSELEKWPLTPPLSPRARQRDEGGPQPIGQEGEGLRVPALTRPNYTRHPLQRCGESGLPSGLGF